MSRENNLGEQKEKTSSSNINRRDFVKSLGATGAVGAFGASKVQAHPEESEQFVTKLEGDEAQRVFEDLSKEPKYDQLKKKVIQRGETLLPEEALIARVDGEQNVVLADVPLADTDADDGHLAIVRNAETGEITAAALEYENEQDGERTRTTLELTDGSSFEEKTEKINIEDVYNADNSDSVHTQDSLTCSACKTAISTILKLGCNATSFVLCNAISAAGIDFMGQSCSEFVDAACKVIQGQNEGGASPQLICAAPGLGFCPIPNP
ncbi:twin-arginine translocation signal domain-containing protein [Halorussus halobius]|uniref:twin-arginine translocation signal domain-containing protein n=1 Tax=Halorussus halobius TaxID=1710537 RepID=UPI0010922ACD|nr:twin-arginine translocation signal domain-containing protein [Halorussus halobius]